MSARALIAEGTQPRGPSMVDPDLEELIRLRSAQGELADGLVRLVPYPRREIWAAIGALEHGLLEVHVPSWERQLFPLPEGTAVGSVAVEVVRREHAIFPRSVQQLRWFYGVVEREDHGGHRQALGQYWRLVLEALARHLGDERASLGPSPHR
jgi:hypothetical protein